MFKYTIKRLLQSVVTVLIVVTIVFSVDENASDRLFLYRRSVNEVYTRAERRAVTGQQDC
mgnify:CR=1 FL=1